MKKLGFEDYFEKHFGKRPATKNKEAKLQDTIQRAFEAQRILDECKRWDINRGAAVFAWSACELTKESR